MPPWMTVPLFSALLGPMLAGFWLRYTEPASRIYDPVNGYTVREGAGRGTNFWVYQKPWVAHLETEILYLTVAGGAVFLISVCAFILVCVLRDDGNA